MALAAGGAAASTPLTIGLLAGVLALLNLLPLPGLDGGHLFLLLLARLGWELSPQRAAPVHCYGVRMVVVASTLGLVARFARVL